MNTKHKSHSLQSYGVTRGRLPQMAGLPGLNGGEAAAAVPPLCTQQFASWEGIITYLQA